MYSFGVQSLYVGTNSPYSPTFESLGAKTVEGVQSATVTLTYPRIEAFGWDGGGTQQMVERPLTDLAFTYVYASGVNEANLGFVSTPSGSISAFSSLNSERNYYLIANGDGNDQIGNTSLTNNRVLALGNGVLTRYDFSAAVGQPTMVSVNVAGLNLLIQPSGANQPLPSIYKQSGSTVTGLYTLPIAGQSTSNYFEASPNALVLTFDTGCAIGTAFSGLGACALDSFGFTIDLPRNEAKSLGWAYPDTRSIQWPVMINLRANGTLDRFQTDAINRFTCPDSGMSFLVGFRGGCSALDGLSFRFNGAKLDSQSFVSQIGDYTKVSLSWSLKIADMNRVGVLDPNFYVISSGAAYSSIIFPQVGYVSGSFPLTYNLSTSCFLNILSGPGLLSGNSVLVTDEASVIVVRASAADGSDTQDLTVTVS